jgi:hypothetical protein
MKNIKLLFIVIFIIPIPATGMDKIIPLTTIFAPTPLVKIQNKNKFKFNALSFLKKATIPLTACFYYGINKNDTWTDISNNPYTTSILIYAMIYYTTYLIFKNQQNKIDEDIIELMEHLFHLLIIGHGIYNKINSISCDSYKTSTGLHSSEFLTLQFFLYKAYNTWFILFSYYQEHYKNKPLYAYHTNQIDLFEVLQASKHEPEILPLITKFYDKNNKIYDYEPILNCLEIKLKLINHKLMKILPT